MSSRCRVHFSALKHCKSLFGFTGIEAVVLVFLIVTALLLLAIKVEFIEQTKADNILFFAASSLASGVIFAHQQWVKNGHRDGDAIDNLDHFRAENLNMTFNGWPRGTTGVDNHTHMTFQSCSEVWNSLVEERWQKKFISNADSGSLGLCRYDSTQTDGYVEYDVRRGKVLLTLS